MPIPLIQADAFADKPFTGNPAAVCFLEHPMPDSWLQAVARENNLAETAYVWRRPDGGFDLRWFTPKMEVALCGHATLASAHVIWEKGWLGKGETARFLTRSGWLSVEPDGPWLRMDFPADPARILEPLEVPEGLAAGLGFEPQAVGLNAQEDYLVEMETEERVRNLVPDLRALASIGGRGVMVTSQATMQGADFVSRFFAPGAGIDEDPVTGSAHCTLGPWWSERLDRTELTGYQASSRGGFVGVHVLGGRVHLRGKAVTVLEGCLTEAASQPI